MALTVPTAKGVSAVLAGDSGPAGRVLVQLLQFLLDAGEPGRVAQRAVACLGLLPEVLWAELGSTSPAPQPLRPVSATTPTFVPPPLPQDTPAPGQLRVELTEADPDQTDRTPVLTVQLAQPDDAEARATVEGVLTLVRTVYRREREVQRLTDEAHTDPLTGLWNRRGFIPFIDQAIARAARTGEDISLLQCDLDHFKAVNDTLGHEAGDRALVAVAGALRSVIRPTDLAARLGGDEIAILLSGSNAQGATRVAHRLAEALEAANPLAPRQLTVSIGIADTRVLSAVVPGPHAREELLRAADEALYMAKSAGRARCICHPDVFAPAEIEDETTIPIQLGAA